MHGNAASEFVRKLGESVGRLVGRINGRVFCRYCLEFGLDGQGVTVKHTDGDAVGKLLSDIDVNVDG